MRRSALTYNARVAHAATFYDTWIAGNERGWDADQQFDGGEFSGPAIGRMQDRRLVEMAANHRVLVGDVLDELTRRTYGDDPLGDWHGRNE